MPRTAAVPLPAPSPDPSSSPSSIPKKSMTRAKVGAVLDLKNIGLGGNWTVQSQDGKRIVVAQMVGDMIVNREITPEQYDLIKNERFNAAAINRARKGVADIGQAFAFTDNPQTTLEIAGFDGQSRKYLVTGTVNGEHVSHWIDEGAARSLTRGQFEGEVSKAIQGDRIGDRIADIREAAKKKRERQKIDPLVPANDNATRQEDEIVSADKQAEAKNAEKIQSEVSREPVSVQADEFSESSEKQSPQQMIQELRTAKRAVRSPRGSLQSGTQAREMSIPTLETPTLGSTSSSSGKTASTARAPAQVSQAAQSTTEIPGQIGRTATTNGVQMQSTIVAQAQATLGVLQQQHAGIQAQRKKLAGQRQALTEQLSRFRGYLKEAQRTGRTDHAQKIRSQMQTAFEERAGLTQHEAGYTIASSSNLAQQRTIQRALAHPTPEILQQLQQQQELISLDEIPELDLEPDVDQEDLLTPPPLPTGGPKIVFGVPSTMRRSVAQIAPGSKEAMAQTLKARSPVNLAVGVAGGKQKEVLSQRGLGETRDQMIMGDAGNLPQPVLQVGAPMWAQNPELNWTQQQAKEKQASESFISPSEEQEVDEADILDESPDTGNEFGRAQQLAEAQEAERQEEMMEEPEDEEDGQTRDQAPPQTESEEQTSSLPLSGFVAGGQKTFLRVRAMSDIATFWTGVALLDFIQIRARQLPLISKKLPKQLRLPDSSLMGQVGTIGCFLFLIFLVVLVIAAISLLIIAALYPLISFYTWIKSIFS